MPTWGENTSGAIFRPGSMMSIPDREFRERVPGAEATGVWVSRLELLVNLAHFPVAALSDLEGCRVEAGRADGTAR
jgi:hypothetical protein